MLIAFLRANADMFAWKPSDMPGVPSEVIEHHLAVHPSVWPVQQKIWQQALERQDSMAGCDLICFLDANSGYHQISMAKEDEEKTSFTTVVGTYCYVRMPLGLKNAGLTFQQTMCITL